MFLFFTYTSYGQGASCASATSINANAFTISAAVDPGSPDLSGTLCPTTATNEGWFMFNAPAGNYTYIVFQNNGSQTAYLYAYTGTCGSLSDMSCTQIESKRAGLINLPTSVGTTYYIRIVQASAGTVGGMLSVYANPGTYAVLCQPEKAQYWTGNISGGGAKNDNTITSSCRGGRQGGWAKFNTTSIPPASSLNTNSVAIKFFVNTTGATSGYGSIVVPEYSEPVSGHASNTYSCGWGGCSSYTGVISGFKANTRYIYNLSNNASTDLINNLSNGWFALDIVVNEGSNWGFGSGTDNFMGWNDTYPPFIVVTYTTSGCTPPIVTAHPASATPCEGADLTLKIGTDGTPPLSYEWRKDGIPIPNATNSTLILNKIINTDAGSYNCVVSNTCPGSVTSNAAVIKINVIAHITTDPIASTTQCEGTNVALNVAADGASNNYQWIKDGNLIKGATSSTLSLFKITSADEGLYICVTSNSCPGSDTSTTAAIKVDIKPLITYTTPDKKKCDLRDTAVFKAIGNGAPFTYQWYHDGVIMTDATIDNYTISGGLSPADAGGYYCVLTNGCGAATTNTSLMTVGTSPVIQKQIPDQTSCAGTEIIFTIDALDVTSYQWTLFGTDIPNATNSTYDIKSCKATDEGIYSCKAGNNCTTISLNSFMFTLGKKPSIGIEPVSNSKPIGDSLIYIITPEGTKPFSYQWQKDGINIDGATKDTLKIKPIKVEDVGAYTCIITNTCGITNVKLGTLTILRDNFLAGTLTYDNEFSTPLNNVRLILTSVEGLPPDTAYTNTAGYFKFEKVKNGNYTLTAFTTKLWGGGDPLDALVCNRYYIDAANFGSNLMRDAADVNGDGYVDPLDALFINRRYLDFINNFDSGNWLFEQVDVIINDADIIYDFKGICFGDVNGSHVPSDK